MRHADALAGELSLVSKSDLGDRRAQAVEQLVDVFARQAPLLKEDAIELYDVALRWLIADLEPAALSHLSQRLADIPNAPYGAVRILAFHDDAAIAAPVLERSPRLEPGDLIAVIGAKGQEHILIIARRGDLTELVTDRLIAVGSAPVLQTLAANGRAPLSRDGSAILLTRANADKRLANALADRFGLPEHLRHRLVIDATAVLKGHLTQILRTAPDAAVSRAISASVDSAAARHEATIATTPVASSWRARLEQTADLSQEHRFLEFLRSRRLREAMLVLAERANIPMELVVAAFSGDDLERMAVMLRAGDLSWAAAEETLAARSGALDRAAIREMLRNRFMMMSQRDAVRLARQPAPRSIERAAG